MLSVEPQRHFGDTSGKVVQDCFCSESSNGYPQHLTAVLEGVVNLPGMELDPTGSMVVFPCASVRTAPRRSRSLNASAVCVMIAEGRALTETRRCCFASTGFVLEVIGDSLANACYTRSSLEQDSPQTSISLTPSDETMDDCVVGARTG